MRDVPSPPCNALQSKTVPKQSIDGIVDPEIKINITKDHDQDMKHQQVKLTWNMNNIVMIIKTDTMQDNNTVNFAQITHTVPKFDMNIELNIPVFFKEKQSCKNAI